MEVTVVVSVITVALCTTDEHAVLSIVGSKGCRGVGVTRPVLFANCLTFKAPGPVTTAVCVAAATAALPPIVSTTVTLPEGTITVSKIVTVTSDVTRLSVGLIVNNSDTVVATLVIVVTSEVV